MIDLIREGREYLIGVLGLTSRLAARIGVLQGSGVFCSRGVLEEIRNFPELAVLLLAPEIKAPAGSLSSVLPELLSREEFRHVASELSLTVTTVGGVQVIALGEEIEAESTGADTSYSLAAPAAEFSAHPLTTRNPGNISLPLLGGRGGGVESAFSNEKIADLRVSVFAGETSAERVSALRRLALSPLPAAEQSLLFIQALGEEDSALRSAAAAVLRRIGLQGEVAESIRLLAEGDEKERIYSCQRIGTGAGEGGPLEVQASLMALLGTIRSDDNELVLEAAVLTLAGVAPLSPFFADYQREIIQLLLEKVLSGSARMESCVRKALRAFEQALPGSVGPYLLNEAGKTQMDSRSAYLLSVASQCLFSESQAAELRHATARCIVSLPAGSEECHGLGSFLMDQGDCGVGTVIALAPSASVGHQRFFIHLLDNALRYRSFTEDTQRAMGGLALRFLENGNRQLCHELFDTRLISLSALSAETRQAIARALLVSLPAFTLESVHARVENALVRLGSSVTESLLQVVTERDGSLEARIACRAIGRISFAEKGAGGTVQLEEVLRTLQRLTFSSSVMGDELAVTMGQICATGEVSEETGALILQGMLNRLQGGVEDAPLLRGIGWLARSPRASQTLLQTIGDRAMGHLETEADETRIDSTFEKGEEIFTFSGAFDVHSELIPSCLEVMSHLLLSSQLDGEWRAAYIHRLLDLWKATAVFRIQWSPGNSVQLSALLGRIAQSPSLVEAVRSKIVHTLSTRLGDIPVLESLAGVLATGLGGVQFDRLAAAVTLRLLGYLDNKRDLTSEDRELYLRVLGQVAQRGRFEVRGNGGDRLLCRVIGELSRGTLDRVSGSLQALTALASCPRSSREVASFAQSELARFTGLSLTT